MKMMKDKRVNDELLADIQRDKILKEIEKRDCSGRRKMHLLLDLFNLK